MGKRSLVLAATLVFVVSMGLPMVAHGAASAAPSAAAGTSASATGAGGAASVLNAPTVTPSLQNNHNLLVIHEIAPGGGTTEDPATAYDTVSYEPILNTYETLVAYNGTTSASFVPVLSTCVPGTNGCAVDYNLTGIAGTDLIANGTSGPTTGQPTYFTFPIDPAAMFYDPSTGNSWHVYPSDVMFSIARTLDYSNLPYVGSQNGWIMAQSLLPYGNGSYDVNASAGQGVHAPFNNTPYHILSSMLINDSTYCPAAALASEGCVTFVANGSGQDWPEFLQFVADGLGASVVPCGVFTANGANVPGFAQVNTPPNGDGSCMLPGGALNTTDTSFQSFLSNPATGSNDTYWDSVQLRALNAPLVDLWPVDNLTGSGPYWSAVSLAAGYTLYANPAYAQPSGCSGAMLYTYVGYCDPVANGYVPQVSVTYDPDDTNSFNGYVAGTIDAGGILPTHTLTELNPLVSEQKIQYTVAHSLSNFFFGFNMYWNATQFTADFPSGTPANVPADFFTGLSARQFFVEAYPYLNVQNSLLSIGGVPYGFEACGPIPQGMGDYYPTNLSCPSGNPDTNASHVGGAAWWWAQGTNPSSPYYDPELAACTVATPCTLPIVGEVGADTLNAADQQWISQVISLTGGAVVPYEFDMTFHDLIVYILFAGAGQNPVPIWNLGWAPDYPDPTDYTVPYVQPGGTFTYPSAVSQQLDSTNTSANQTLCGHDSGSQADIAYWAYNVAQYQTACQGIAYDMAMVATTQAAPLQDSPQRVLLYNEMSQIVNKLGIYTWFEQQNTIPEVAPWIDLSSVNLNPSLGGGGDQPFFQWRFNPPQTVEFDEKKLPTGVTWSITANGLTKNNTTILKPGSTHSEGTIIFYAANGTFNFTITSPAGYGVASMGGHYQPNQTNVKVPGANMKYKVKFGPLEPLYFYQNITAHKGQQHMYAGAPWQVWLNTSKSHGGDPNTYELSGTNYTLGPLMLPHGGHYKFNISGFPSIYKAHPFHGGTGIPLHEKDKKIAFKTLGVNVKFKESGLTAPYTWNITLTGASGAAAAWFAADCGGFGCTLAKTNGSAIVFKKLPTGTYNWTAATTTPGVSATPASGTVSVDYNTQKGTTIKVLLTWA